MQNFVAQGVDAGGERASGGGWFGGQVVGFLRCELLAAGVASNRRVDIKGGPRAERLAAAIDRRARLL